VLSTELCSGTVLQTRQGTPRQSTKFLLAMGRKVRQAAVQCGEQITKPQ
jgi:hypothetical protein